jgi:1-aminocyclopropane-1-carboxylate deaminase
MKINDIEKIISENIDEQASILQKIKFPDIETNINVYLKREDLIHPAISGNKWRKLKYNLRYAKEKGMDTILTFGGAYSNHIHAVSAAGKIFGINTIGIIRGEKTFPLNSTLSFAEENGMLIDYVDRSTYRKKTEPAFIDSLKGKYGQFYLVPEGGTNQLAIKGSSEIIKNINIDYQYIISACGTGGTISGIICSLKGEKQIIGIPVLKGADFLKVDISRYVKEFTGNIFSNWKLEMDYHFGGYAKITKELVVFINKFNQINKVHLDPIYTGKLLFGIQSMIKRKAIIENSTIIAIHTGGLQGIEGMKNKMDKLLS